MCYSNSAINSFRKYWQPNPGLAWNKGVEVDLNKSLIHLQQHSPKHRVRQQQQGVQILLSEPTPAPARGLRFSHSLESVWTENSLATQGKLNILFYYNRCPHFFCKGVLPFIFPKPCTWG